MTLTIDQLCIQYGGFIALDSISCSAARGKVVAVVGPNASGKSTLLRACMGSLRLARGRILLDGKPARDWSTRALAARMAYVPQQSLVAGGFTVQEVVEIGRYALPPDRARIERALDLMHVADLCDRPFMHLSHGQQQRVTLARALAQSPDDGFLVLDEAMSAMDLDHMLKAMRLLRRLAGEGKGVVLALHDLDAAAHFADEAWLLRGGRLVTAGDARDVLTPQRLADVFGASFDEVQTAGVERHLVPIFDPRHRA